jgi:hypothetical protein
MSETTPSSGRYPHAPRVRRAAPVAVIQVQSVSSTFTIAGFPLATWAFALRIWAAMMVALYAAFWLQLESASLLPSPSPFSPGRRGGRPTKRPSTGSSPPSSGSSPRS